MPNTNRVWRMSFRVGNRGPSLWEKCKALKVAAITYYPIENVDLSSYPRNEPANRWHQLPPSCKYSLRSVAYRMKRGDTIYVKHGNQLVGRGKV